jgi:hypothetical protein
MVHPGKKIAPVSEFSDSAALGGVAGCGLWNSGKLLRGHLF